MFDGSARALQWLTAVSTALAVAGCSTLHPPIEDAEIASVSSGLVDGLKFAPEPLHGRLSLVDAVRRAVAHNQSLRAKELEAELAAAQARALAGAMLPSIVAEIDYFGRNRPLLTHSSHSDTYSTSSDLRTLTRDIVLSWNVLDFGLSFVRTRQAVDKAYQKQATADRARANIVEETRTVFWRAVALEKLDRELPRLDRDVDAALAVSTAQAQNSALDPMPAVSYQRDLLNARRELNDLRVRLAGTTDQLKQVIGQPLIQKIELDASQRRAVPQLPTSTASEDVSGALQTRPEIREIMYDMRISEDEIYATILKALPGITLDTRFSSDTNSYLLHSNWMSWATKLAGNLINLARLPDELEVTEGQQSVHRQVCLATAAAIAMQVHVARAHLSVQWKAHDDANRFARSQRVLLRLVTAAVRAGRVAPDTIVREKLATLLAETRATIAFAELQAAAAAYATAKGEAPDRTIAHCVKCNDPR